MNFIFCVFSLSAIATFQDFVQADKEQDLNEKLRNADCNLKSQLCQNQMVTKVTQDEIMGLCNAKPLVTTSTKCLMDCQMRQYQWIKNNVFNINKYLKYIKGTELGHDQTYLQAAKKVAGLCKDKKAAHSDSCETAYLILKCLQDEGDKLQKINLGYALFYVEPYFLDFD